MKKLLVAGIVAIVASFIIGSSALAWTPPGQRGYEGQPGNQGGYHQAGQQGYEGQPGNQSNG